MCYAGVLPFTLSSKIFLCAIKEYYETCKIKQNENSENNLYIKNYRIFIIELIYFLKDYNLYNYVITEDEIQIYSAMFEKNNMKYIEKTLNGLDFMLDDMEKQYYLKRLKTHIHNLDIYD